MSIFNPWVILGFILSLAAAGTSGYFKGVHSEQDRQKLVIAKLNEEARSKEEALVGAVHKQATQFVKANNEAKLLSQKRSTDIASGAIKLRIPIKTPVCPVPATTDAAAPARDSVQARAELDPEVARSLVAITEQGDANTRQLNACIEAYNAVYQTLKGTK